MKKIIFKRQVSVLLVIAVILSCVAMGFNYTSTALSGGSWRVWVRTRDNNTANGLDQGTNDNVVVKFWTGDNGTGTCLFTSGDLSGTENGGNSGNTTFNFSPPVSLRSITCGKNGGSDGWGIDNFHIYYTPAGGAEQVIIERDISEMWDNNDQRTQYNGPWFYSTHNRSITFNGNGADGGSTATMNLVWGTGEYLSGNGFYKTGYSFAGWATTSGGSVAYSNGANYQYMPDSNVTLYAKWNINNYTMTFDANGGNGGTSTSMTYGSALTAPTVTRTGYTFTGWSPSVPSTVPAANTTFTAQWSINSYNIWFDEAGGSAVSDIYQQYGSAVTAPANPTRTGYTFAGWSPAVPSTMPANNTNCVAQWNIGQYTVSFESNGGSAVSPITQNYNTSVSEPTAPTKTGNTFQGWYYDPGLTTAVTWPYTMGASSATFYAKWSVNSYYITFDANGGNGGWSQSMQYGAAITAPTVTRTGYDFGGWSPSVPSTVPVGGGEYVAQWTPKQYTVSFESNGGSTVSPITQNYGTSVAEPAAPSKTGSTFIGWCSDTGLTTPVSWPYTLGAVSVTFYAKWSVNNYTITFDANGGSGGTSSSMQYGAALSAPTVVRTGYTFNGWDPSVPSTVPAANSTYTAQWTINQYTITFHTNGGEAVAPITQNYYTQVSEPAAPAKTGHTFDGWYSDVDLTNPVTWPYTIQAYDVDFYAKWSVSDYSVTFDANGGVGGWSDYLPFGGALEAPAVARLGYTFNGWSPAVPATVQEGGGTYVAQWVANGYTVNYDGNGSTGGSTASSSHTYDIAANLTANGFTRTGHNFLGWSTTQSAQTADYTDGQSVTNLSSQAGGVVTFYAVWSVNNYTITFNANGGEGGSSASMTFGETLTAPSVIRTGYTLTGWSPAVPATVPGEDSTYTAQWSVNSYTITFDADGGTGGTSASMEYGATLTAPEVTKEGHTFLGWSPAVPATVPAGDATYTALWSVNSVTLTFNAGAHGLFDGQSTVVLTLDYGAVVTAPSPDADFGWAFSGWDKTVPETASQDDTFTAQYAETLIGVTVVETGLKINIQGWNEDYQYQIWSWQKVTSDILLDVNSDVPANQWILSMPYTLGSDESAIQELDGSISFIIGSFVSPDNNYTVAVRILDDSEQFENELRDTFTPADVQEVEITKVLVDGEYAKNTMISEITETSSVLLEVIGNDVEGTVYTATVIETSEAIAANGNEFVWNTSALPPGKYTVKIDATNNITSDTVSIPFHLYSNDNSIQYGVINDLVVTAAAGDLPIEADITPTFQNGTFYYQLREPGRDVLFNSAQYTMSGNPITHTVSQYGTYYFYGYVNRIGVAISGESYDDGSIRTLRVLRGGPGSGGSSSSLTLTANVNLDNPVAKNTAIVFTANAVIAGLGSTPVEYSYWRHDAKGYALVKDWSSDNTLDWTPARVGKYTIEVRAKGEDAGSYEVLKSVVVYVNDSVDEIAENVSITLNQAQINAGAQARKPIVLRANATSTNGDDLLYKFLVYDDDMMTRMIQDYSVNQECLWVPRKAGDYTISVLVKNKVSFGRYDAIAEFDVTVS